MSATFRLLEDSRFEFMFGPTCSEWPSVMHSLATFMRDILGAGCLREAGLTGTDACPEGQLPFYDRQRGGSTRSSVVIIDLSLLASEVLENVTALIGRLIHEFLQRLSDPVSGVGRGDYPVVLILGEAQNYIREGRRTEEDSISKLVFECIAREGRKYGLGRDGLNLRQSCDTTCDKLTSESSRSTPKTSRPRHPDSIFSATGWTTTSSCC